VIELDARIAAGMQALLAARDERVRAGRRQIGWKLAFGAPAAAAALGIDRPLVGVLMDDGVIEDGASVPVGDWTSPVLEVEIAAHLCRDIAPDATADDVRDAIDGLAAAIELVDIDGPRDDIPAVLATNIFHRHVALGPLRHGAGAEGVTARVRIDGGEVAATDDPSALTGELVKVLALTAEQLAACGERLSAGDVVIAGSVVPPQGVRPGQRVAAEVAPLGTLALELTERATRTERGVDFGP
jgi:2-keto-4-pentenoate hydratase